MHSGYRDYLVTSVESKNWQKIAEKLPQCRSVLVGKRERWEVIEEHRSIHAMTRFLFSRSAADVV